MVYLITGATHIGKTLLAQKILEIIKYPYLSIDHIKMGLIRSGCTNLTPYDELELTDYLWPIVVGIIKTVIENKQNIIIEGIYIPKNWRDSFDGDYLRSIKFIALAFTSNYINKSWNDIIANRDVIEKRKYLDEINKSELKLENELIIDNFKNDNLVLIDDNYQDTINKLLKSIGEDNG